MESTEPIETQPGRIVVEVVAGEPVSGVLHVAGRSREFEGWIELLAALEPAVTQAAPRSAQAENPR